MTTRGLRQNHGRPRLAMVVHLVSFSEVAVAFLNLAIALRISHPDLYLVASAVSRLRGNGVHLALEGLHSLVDIQIKVRLDARVDIRVPRTRSIIHIFIFQK